MLKIKIILTIFLSLISVNFVFAEEVSLDGWIWSDTVGWVSLKSNQNDITGESEYGVKINFEENEVGVYEDGTIVDNSYGWSDNLGWIDFSPDNISTAPSEPKDLIKYNQNTREITGWVRAVNGIGSDIGWIKFGGTGAYQDATEYKYEVKRLDQKDILQGSTLVEDYNKLSCNFDGYAWGSTVIGWLDVSPQFDNTYSSMKFDEDSGCKRPYFNEFKTEETDLKVIKNADGTKLTWEDSGDVAYYKLEANITYNPFNLTPDETGNGKLLDNTGGITSNSTNLSGSTNEFTVKPVNLIGGKVRYVLKAYNKFGDEYESNSIEITVSYELVVKAWPNIRYISNQNKLNIFTSIESGPLDLGNYKISLCKEGTGINNPCEPLKDSNGVDIPPVNYAVSQVTNDDGVVFSPTKCPGQAGCQNFKDISNIVKIPFVTPPNLSNLEFNPTPNIVSLDGWIWSDTVGWISLKSNQNDITGESAYGLKMNFPVDEKGIYTNGTIVNNSYGWSDNIGWIDFSPDDINTAPSESKDLIKYNQNTREITGWARAVNGIGSDIGWIRFGGSGAYPDGTEYKYEVKRLDQDIAPCSFDGYAWGSTVIGWLDVSPQSGGIYSSMKFDEDSGCKKLNSLEFTNTVNINNIATQPVTKSEKGIELEWNSVSDVAYYKIKVNRVDVITQIEPIPTGKDKKDCMIYHTRDSDGKVVTCNTNYIDLPGNLTKYTVYPINLEGGKVEYSLEAYNKFGDKIDSDNKLNVISSYIDSYQYTDPDGNTTIGTLEEIFDKIDSEPIVFKNVAIPSDIDALGVFTLNVIAEYTDNDPSNGVVPYSKEGITLTIRNIGYKKYKEISP